jgi:16S rRNA (guanine1516-N2)-methyltransferase
VVLPLVSKEYRLLANRLGILANEQSDALSDFILSESNSLIALSPVDKNRGGSIHCDFLAPGFQRYLSSVTRKSLIAKACGLKGEGAPSILDISAGLGKDALSLASLGAQVSMVEANPYVYLLLYSGIHTLKQSSLALSSNISLLACQDAKTVLSQSDRAYEVIYFDPMFPERKKSAKVKKEMQYFHQVVGEDHNQPDEIFTEAVKQARKRLVIKRPKGSDFYADQKPNYSLESKVIRYDIYLNFVE